MLKQVYSSEFNRIEERLDHLLEERRTRLLHATLPAKETPITTRSSMYAQHHPRTPQQPWVPDEPSWPQGHFPATFLPGSQQEQVDPPIPSVPTGEQVFGIEAWNLITYPAPGGVWCVFIIPLHL